MIDPNVLIALTTVVAAIGYIIMSVEMLKRVRRSGDPNSARLFVGLAILLIGAAAGFALLP